VLDRTKPPNKVFLQRVFAMPCLRATLPGRPCVPRAARDKWGVGL